MSEKLSRLGIRRRDHTKPKGTVEDADEENQNREGYGGFPPESPSEKPDADGKKKQKKRKWTIPESLRWIPANMNYAGLKPVIRSAIAAWVSVVVFVIPRVNVFIGQSSFLLLVAAGMSAPSDPFLSVLEREILIMFFVSLSWAWCCLGIKLADLARDHHTSTVDPSALVHGQYLETGPTIIIAVFLFLGSSFFLFVRAHQGPGPYLFPTVLACICLDIALTTAVLYPYPNYKGGRSVVIPLVFHSAIALATSIVVFPTSISSHFAQCLRGVLSPLIKALDLHQRILATSPYAQEFVETAGLITKQVGNSETALSSMASAARLLTLDLIYGRYAPSDLNAFQDLARRLAARGNGMGVYFVLIHPTHPRFPATPAPSGVGTPTISRSETRITRSHSREELPRRISMPEAPETPSNRNGDTPGSPRRSSQSHHVGPFDLHRQLRQNLLRRALQPRVHRFEHPVGVFESQRYMDLEAERFNDPFAEVYTEQTTQNLSASCHDLLNRCRGALLTITGWLDRLHEGRIRYLWETREIKAKWERELTEHQRVRDELSAALEIFRSQERHRVLDPYRPAFDAEHDPTEDHDLPAHRYLFQAFVYQFHLIQFTNIVLEMLDQMIGLQHARKTQRLWHPAARVDWWRDWNLAEQERGEDEDPDKIQGLDPRIEHDLGLPQRRDPDALPPRNIFEQVMGTIYHSLTGLEGGNVLFAMKAGVLTVLLALPIFLKSSVYFAYNNKFVWGIIMGQVTIARFQGDTGFALLVRIFSTFFGSVTALIIWYISVGVSGKGNPYGLAAVCAVAFPFLFFVRIHWPAKPLTIVVYVLTCMLVIGYSYQDVHQKIPGSPGYGFNVAWRRFVLVAAGVFAAFLMSMLPPAKTLRLYTRYILATTSNELGAIYCAVIGYAYSPRKEDVHEISVGLIAVRGKLRRSVALRDNVVYEPSFRGRWPEERYHKLFELQLQITYNLSHLMAVYTYLEPAWARALLRRTKFLDTDFQGDILAVITLICSALRTGSPLPQITPCPLLDRFMEQHHGLEIIHKESEEDYGLPRTLTLDTLQNEQYMYFSVGVSTSYGLVTRLDRLMVAVKEIVGEQYHIHGFGVGSSFSRGLDPGAAKRTTIQFGTPQDV
ncbi:putative ER transporter, 6TM, N-terminal [Lyophyllum shimeji]|uniref:ER transporter, 6TM, N-terminal n=1 Tax=Lyophyllum shimeji TaxID=47721 RepID=A0A9P3PH39_LYOSH|nr:putative ER transporter, 6TM, N-terminal [Lyophyllum shimeji]